MDLSPLLIRLMNSGDLPLGRHLVHEAGWNQTDSDWLRAMKLAPQGCFVAEKDGKGVATTTSCCFENAGWIAMVLVDKKSRGSGIAQRLVEHAVTYLENRGVRSIRLDATAMGQGLYQKLGFKPEYEVIRYAGTLKQNVNQTLSAKRVAPDTPVINELASIDRYVTGSARKEFISGLMESENAPFYYQTDSRGRVTGYAGFRRGSNAVQLGPVVALTRDTGQILLDAIVADFTGQPCYIDIPASNIPATKWAIENGFTEQRRFVRMYRGEKTPDHQELIWASSGPEKG